MRRAGMRGFPGAVAGCRQDGGILGSIAGTSRCSSGGRLPSVCYVVPPNGTKSYQSNALGEACLGICGPFGQ